MGLDGDMAKSFAQLRHPSMFVLSRRSSVSIPPSTSTAQNSASSSNEVLELNNGTAVLEVHLDTITKDVTDSLTQLPKTLTTLADNQESYSDSSSSPVSNTRVVRTIDGDTLVIEWKGKEESVRLIGVDTPESVDPRTTIQCFGREASAALKAKASGQPAYFIPDPGQGERDKYNRLLGYVFLDDGTLLNNWLIAEGYGFEYTYNLPYRYQQEFQSAEKSAQAKRKGLWASDTCNGQRASDASTPWQPVRNDDRDCSSFNTQREAQDFFEANEGSSTNDPHNLDRDHDGKACELLP